ncbi:hypothetical protein [Ruegeria halocynthiae]|nr:hypothetical protein [Ruegeria halocynthiae]
MASTFFSVLPFVIGKRYLTTTESHLTLLKVICFAMLGYSILALWEVRMSPQLNRTIYGYFPHSFGQHIRADGFRPVVFFDHGLSLGLFLSMSLLSSITVWRFKRESDSNAALWIVSGIWLLLTLILAKTLAVLVVSLLLMPFAILLGVRGQLVLAAGLSAVVLLYPMLRGAGYIPTDSIYQIAADHDEARAQSLKYRLDNEDNLLERANLRPITGWGSWGRNHIYDDTTGRQVSVTDGMWIIIIGMFGWVGYSARFGLLTIPVMILALNRKKLDVSIVTSGLALVLALNLVDLLPNAALTPITWLLAGALAGRCVHQNDPVSSNLREDRTNLQRQGIDKLNQSDNGDSLAPAELRPVNLKQRRKRQ